jgi:hypothetical protein
MDALADRLLEMKWINLSEKARADDAHDEARELAARALRREAGLRAQVAKLSADVFVRRDADLSQPSPLLPYVVYQNRFIYRDRPKKHWWKRGV